eukprot:258607-Hanusia_phi.AAC.1
MGRLARDSRQGQEALRIWGGENRAVTMDVLENLYIGNHFQGEAEERIRRERREKKPATNPPDLPLEYVVGMRR